MNINKIKLGGVANISKVNLTLKKLTSLIALNNYGKSNVLNAIDFGFDFISQTPSNKDKMMSYKPFIPYNQYIDEKPFSFEVDLNIEKFDVNYSYSFIWIKDNSKGKQIATEELKIREVGKNQKYSTYIKRNNNNAKYLPSVSGRCNKEIQIESNELVLNKLLNFDELFYLDIISKLNAIKVASVDTLQNPEEIYSKIKVSTKIDNIVKKEFSLLMDDANDSSYFVFSLMKVKPHLYELYKDAILTLLPSIQDFEPIEIDLKSKLKFQEEKQNLPINFPEKLYDIRVKEKNNNQQTSVTSLSSGSQKIFYLVSVLIGAEINKVPLILLEELENSIHPGLLQKLLIVIDSILEFPKVIFSSHSPYLIQYLNYDSIEVGVPNKKGLACFKKFRKSKFTKMLSMADEEGISIGDMLFERMLEEEDERILFFKEMCY